VIAIEELAMLRPHDTSTRERKCLNGLWPFALDQAGEGRSGQWFAKLLAGAREVAVPASFNDIAADAAVRDWDYQVEYLDMNHRVFDRIDAVVAEHVWNFAEFVTTSGIIRVGGNKKGVFTRDRQPNAAAQALCGRWRDDL
jgi:beta-galactosidase/beta-glucuronidase